MNSDGHCVQPLPDQAAREAAQTCLDVNLLLQAGAGSGKTSALVDRYLYILDHDKGADIDNIVAITFTRKAAREMKERIRAALAKRMETAEGSDLRRLRERVRKLETAPICTIHSLCASLLEQYPFAANLDPRFTLLDEVQTTLQLSRTVEESLVAGLNEERDTAVDVVSHLGGLAKAQRVIVELLRRRAQYYEYLCNPPTAEAILRDWQEIERSACEEMLASFEQELKARGLLAELEGAARVAQKLQRDDKLAVKVLTAWELLHQGSPTDVDGMLSFSDAISSATKNYNVGNSDNWGGDDRKKAVQGTLKSIKEAAENCFKPLKEAATQATEKTAQLAAAIWAEAANALKAWREIEDSIPALDFDDVQIRLRDLLRTNEDVRHAVQTRFRHVLVDEFQDTDGLQRDLVWLIAGLQEGGERAGRVFLVGDAKQSIYRFRNADVTVFNEACQEFERAADARVERLSATFRAHTKLVEFFNALFRDERLLGERAEREFEVAYESMKAIRGPLGEAPWVFGMLAVADENDSAVLQRVAEAELIAKVVRRLLDARPLVYDHDQDAYRPLGPGDIAILFRAAGDVRIYEEELDRLNIPYYNAAGRGFYTRPEVTDLLNLMRAVANPQDEVALVGVLRSPLFAVSDATLFCLAQARGTWWQRLMNAPQAIAQGEEPYCQMAAEEHPRIRLAAELLAQWRDVYERIPVSSLLEQVLESTGYSAAMAALPAGERCVANIHKLLDRAREFDRAGRGDLAAFAEELTSLAEEDVKEEQAPTEEEYGDSVRLSTIHGAKGLQWPVVIVADLDRREQQDAALSGVRMHPKFGIVPAEVDLGPDAVWRLAGQVVKMANDEEEAAERKRLLYVALTRASEILIMSAGVKLEDNGEIKTIGGAWLANILEACGVGPIKWEPEAQGRMEIRSHLCPWFLARRGAEPDLSWLDGLSQMPPSEEEATEALPRHVDLAALLVPVPPDASARQRFTVTELARYLQCPRYYWLRYVEGLPDQVLRQPSSSTGLSALDIGNLAHHLLRMVGTGGLDALESLLGPIIPGGRALRSLDESDVAVLRGCLVWYLEHDFYRQTIAGARLRTEAPVSFPLGDVLVEGKMDAVADTDDGLVVIDYKTGVGPEEGVAGLEDEGPVDADRFQVALYAYGLRVVTGEWPREGVIVYLREPGRIERVLMPQEAEEAARKALRAVTEITQGLAGVPPGGEHECSACRLEWACKKVETA